MVELLRRQEFCRWGEWLFERRLIGATEGNISARISDGHLICTPASACKALLQPADIVTTDLRGVPVHGGIPSSEIRAHLIAYELRPDCHAVVHAHPQVASGFAMAGETIPFGVSPEADSVLGPVRLLEFAYPGTEDVAEGMRSALPDCKTFLLSNHGALTLGRSLQDAAFRMEVLERVATMVLVARNLGGPRAIPEPSRSLLAATFLNGAL